MLYYFNCKEKNSINDQKKKTETLLYETCVNIELLVHLVIVGNVIKNNLKLQSKDTKCCFQIALLCIVAYKFEHC